MMRKRIKKRMCFLYTQLLILTKRGDATAVQAARESAQWVIGHADFVGGLEFQAVIVVGVDGGRVPPNAGNDNFSSKSFLSYVSHNRLYVAISRARYRVELLGERARGASRLIAPAIEAGLAKFRLDQTKAAKVIKAQQAKDKKPADSVEHANSDHGAGDVPAELAEAEHVAGYDGSGRQLLPPALRRQHRRRAPLWLSSRRFQAKLLPQRPPAKKPRATLVEGPTRQYLSEV
jgi:hypothetical protein